MIQLISMILATNPYLIRTRRHQNPLNLHPLTRSHRPFNPILGEIRGVQGSPLPEDEVKHPSSENKLVFGGRAIGARGASRNNRRPNASVRGAREDAPGKQTHSCQHGSEPESQQSRNNRDLLLDCTWMILCRNQRCQSKLCRRKWHPICLPRIFC